MKKLISVLLCAAVLISSVLGGALVTSAEGETYTGSITDYTTDKTPTDSTQNKIEQEGGQETFTGNLALNRPTVTSGVEQNSNVWIGAKAVDGDKTLEDNEGDSRWSSNYMKGQGLQNGQQTPAWIYIDLGAEKATVTSISIYYYRVVWATNMQIQTTDTPDVADSWETLATRTPEQNSDLTEATVSTAKKLHPVDTINSTEVPAIANPKRYIRFYASTMNSQAGGDALSILEIEIEGTQKRQIGEAPATAQEAINSISTLTVNEDGTSVEFPAMHEGFEFSIKGSDVDSIISDTGAVSPYVIGDHDVTVLAQVTKTDTGETAEKNFDVHVKDTSANFSNLFEEVENHNAKPGVIPAVQEWYGLEGRFTPSADTKVIYKDEGAAETAAKISEVLSNIGYETTCEKGEESQSTDIYFELLGEGDKYSIGDEGNVIIANDNGIKVYANTVKGLLYGGYTVAQGLVTGDGSFPYGIIRDYPKFEIRGVMLDIARSPFRLETLEMYQDVLSWFKINEFHMHINDDRHTTTGSVSDYNFWKDIESYFRLESDTFPDLTSTAKTSEYFNDENGFGGTAQYSKDEWKQFLQRGMDLGIDMITEIDMPGHSLAFTQYVHEILNGTDEEAKNELKELGITEDIASSRTWELMEINPNDSSYTSSMNFIKALFSEYLDPTDPVFVGNTVQIGAEEVWNITNEEKTGLKNYIEEVKKIIEAAGKKVRMWGNITSYLKDVLDSTDTYAEDIALDIWDVSYENVADRIRDGYDIVNLNNVFLYNNALRDNRDVVNVEYLYESWNPYRFSNYTAKTGEPSIIGAKTSIWQDVTDMGVTETDNTERVLRAAAILAEKTWGGQGEQTYADYSFLLSKLLSGPNKYDPYAENDYLVTDVDFSEQSDIKTEESEDTVWGVFDGTNKIETNIESVSYPYTVSFKIQKGTNDKEVKLFSGKDGWLTLTADGKLKIYRAFHEQQFDYTLTDKATDITIVGTQEALKLYVNGEFVKMLGRINANESTYTSLSTTFDFPLKNIADGFVGKLADIKVYARAMSPEDIKAIHNGEVIDYVNVAQGRGVAGDAQDVGLANWDNADKKLRVGWKAIDGDGNAIGGEHSVTYSEKDSFFEGRHNNSSIALDFWRVHDISKIVLQWDKTPLSFKLQYSDDGKNWQDIENGTYTATTSAASVTTVELDEPIKTRYLKMQGISVDSTFQLREFMALEKVEKENLGWIASSYAAYIDEENAAKLEKRAAQLIDNPFAEQSKVKAAIEECVEGAADAQLVDGDANSDNTLNIKDATLIQKYASKIVDQKRLNYFTADANGDGVIDGTDTTVIQKYLAGYTTSLKEAE